MTRYLRYTTFAPGELERRLRELSPHASLVSLPGSVPSVTHSRSGEAVTKAHEFTVTFPDHTTGTCRYERLAPKWHRFHFDYEDGTRLPSVMWEKGLANDLSSLEAKGQELAARCFAEAVLRERKEYFCRASEPSDGTRKRRPEVFRMKAEMAKAKAGIYVLCYPRNGVLSSFGAHFSTLEEANHSWRQQTDRHRMVVACCNRLDRCWECPKFNPLYAEIGRRDRLGRPLELAMTLAEESVSSDISSDEIEDMEASK